MNSTLTTSTSDSKQPPLRILLDGRKLGDGGIGVYIQNLVDGLILERTRGFPLEITLIVPESLSASCTTTVEGWKGQLKLVRDSAKKYSSDEYLMMPRRLRSVINECDVYHSPHYTLPAQFRKNSLLPFRKRSIPSVVTIHDAIHLMAPESFSQRFFGSLLIRSAVRRAHHVITVSAASLSRLSRLFPGVAISVVPNALAKGIGLKSWAEVQRVVQQFELSQPYVVFVGSDRPHKGFVELIEALSMIEDFKPMVVVVGDRFSDAAKLFAANKLGAKRLRFVGSVSQADLAAFYNGARAVMVPSRIEGFGLVALEALAAGAPLVCSPELSLREIANNCAWYADSFSAEDFSIAIKRCFEERELAEEKATQGIIQAREFSCERVAAGHLQAYIGVLPPERAKYFLQQTEAVLSYTNDLEVMALPEISFDSPEQTTAKENGFPADTILSPPLIAPSSNVFY